MNEQSLNEQQNQNNLDSLIEIKPIANSPLQLVIDKRKEKHDISVVLGEQVVKKYETEKEAITAVKRKDWDILVVTAAIFVNYMNNKENKNNE